ncbi:hypothetical protein JJL56_26295 [Azospirillum sp. YIM DDC1]|uniref:Uncharacterized protein n=3 Tax=Azospirillaceae TaxID=2829815 RepID=A0A4D8Q044_9PROT|nr:hypothetical protein [Azospirillum aestuarii]QCO00220.1 hypothetical protein D3093_33825 [Azospirillum argentinense]
MIGVKPRCSAQPDRSGDRPMHGRVSSRLPEGLAAFVRVAPIDCWTLEAVRLLNMNDHDRHHAISCWSIPYRGVFTTELERMAKALPQDGLAMATLRTLRNSIRSATPADGSPGLLCDSGSGSGWC